MKTSKHTFILFIVAIIMCAMLSWTHSATNNAGKESIFYNKIFSVANIDMPWAGDSPEAIMEAENGFNSTQPDNIPAAEDVLVQKIPGDNYHLLIMAVYSFNNYSGQFVKIDNNGQDLVLRDDGREYDKVAGEGVFTVKIYADVNEFRKEALKMDAEDKKNPNRIRFVDRELRSPAYCNTEPFDATKLDNFQPVSIADISGGSNSLIDSVRNNCIFITELSVVEDPARTWNPCTQTGNVDGAWTFKTLMKNLAKDTAIADPTPAQLSTFVLSWLNNWKAIKVINRDSVPVRFSINKKVITPWQNKSLAAGNPAGQLDMRFAPFKLTSIVNRFDIRERAAGIPAGEGRYTFCLIDSTCTKALEMTVVIEYAIPKINQCDTLRAWAKQWFDLKDFTLGSPEYNIALQAITDQYSLWGTSNRPNHTNLDALRTNEREFAPTDGTPRRWEFREFTLSVAPRKLVQKTVSQIPMDKYNAQVDNPDVRAMVAWINANKGGINNDNYTVPDTLANGAAFLGGHSQILDTPVGIPPIPYHWDGIEPNGPAHITNTTTRQVFSRNTCTGCHAGELQTFFTHVDPVFFGTQATLSGFLTGTAGRGGAIDFDGNPANDSFMVKDGANRGGLNNSLRFFNEKLRRAKDLKDFVISPPCGSPFAIRNELMFKPLHAVH
ncbi:hypothetical protein BH11BAC6_BH11BAC6_07990 [soil metagenome]